MDLYVLLQGCSDAHTQAELLMLFVLDFAASTYYRRADLRAPPSSAVRYGDSEQQQRRLSSHQAITVSLSRIISRYSLVNRSYSKGPECATAVLNYSNLVNSRDDNTTSLSTYRELIAPAIPWILLTHYSGVCDGCRFSRRIHEIHSYAVGHRSRQVRM